MCRHSSWLFKVKFEIQIHPIYFWNFIFVCETIESISGVETAVEEMIKGSFALCLVFWIFMRMYSWIISGPLSKIISKSTQNKIMHARCKIPFRNTAKMESPFLLPSSSAQFGADAHSLPSSLTQTQARTAGTGHPRTHRPTWATLKSGRGHY